MGVVVVLVLSEHEKVRFNELCRLIPDVSSRVLSGTLKTLEADALVSAHGLSGRSAQGRVSADGAGALPGAVDCAADRVGADQHQEDRRTPQAVRVGGGLRQITARVGPGVGRIRRTCNPTIRKKARHVGTCRAENEAMGLISSRGSCRWSAACPDIRRSASSGRLPSGRPPAASAPRRLRSGPSRRRHPPA